MNYPYDPNSLDATLARIIANQEAADRKQDAILEQVLRTNGRVLVLEGWRSIMAAKLSIVAAAAAAAFSAIAWAFKYYVEKFLTHGTGD